MTDTMERLGSLLASAVEPGDVLYDYFRESLGIVSRLLTAIDAPVADDELRQRLNAVYRIEARSLIDFLQEELRTHARRKQTRYTDLDVTDRGLVGDGQTNNHRALADLLQEVRAQGRPTRLIFPQGRYLFAGPAGKAEGSIDLADMHDLIVEGQGDVTWVTSGEPQAGDSLRLRRCANVVFRHLTMDMTPLPFVAGRVLRKDPDNSTIDIELTDASPDPDDSYQGNQPISIREADSYRYVRDAGNGLALSHAEPLGPRTWRLHLVDGDFSAIDLGATAVWHPRGRAGSGSGIRIDHCRHVLFENLHMQAADLVCVWAEFSGGVQFIDCDFVPPPGRSALVNADGIHAPRNIRGPYLENCRLFGPNDDCLNFYSPAFSVARWDAPRRALTILLDFPGDPLQAFQDGDPVVLINSDTGTPDALARVESVRTVPWAQDAPDPPVRHQKAALELTLDRDLPPIHTREQLGRALWASYDEYWRPESPAYQAAAAIQAPHEHMAVNVRYTNTGFILRNCQFGYNRALGFKCKAGNGVIRNCHFIDQAVLFETSLTWREGFLPHDIEVTDTRIDWFCLVELGLLSGVRRGPEALALMPRISVTPAPPARIPEA